MNSFSPLVKSIIDRVVTHGCSPQLGRNVIAFSGGVDSSVVAAVVFQVFPTNSTCVIGTSASLPTKQLEIARSISRHIGICLKEVATREQTSKTYVDNEGLSCYSCKVHLYSALQETCDAIHKDIVLMSTSPSSTSRLTIFNGTNKDDISDKTRVGLRAAREYSVASPLDHLTKIEVRQAALELGLPNHDYAASPCLRSRLAFGVRATPSNLSRIEAAEELVRDIVKINVIHNMRVRHLRDNSARVELDAEILRIKEDQLLLAAEALSDLGFSEVKFAPFRSGSVAYHPSQ